MVVLVTLVCVAGSRVLHAELGPGGLQARGVLVAGLAAVAFLGAATLRWAVHLVTRRPEARMRAAAVGVVGLVLMPTHLWTHGLVDVPTASSGELVAVGALRVACVVATLALLLLAVARPRAEERIRIASLACWSAAAALLCLGAAATWRPGSLIEALAAISFFTAVLWAVAAVYVAQHVDTRPWARHLPTFLLLMGVTELLVASDPGTRGTPTTAALLVTLAVSVCAVTGSAVDLQRAARTTRRHEDGLVAELVRTRDDLDALRDRERRLAHDARGTLAGLRAALRIWDDGGTVDATRDLRVAAMVEIGRLELALREHRVELGCGPVALDEVVDRAVRVPVESGGEVVVSVPRLVVLGQATDLELAVREVVDHVLGHTPGRLHVRADHGAGRVTVVVRPTSRERRRLSAPSAGSPGRDGVTRLDRLEHAEHLMRRQGGTLVVDPATQAVELGIALCPPPRRRATTTPPVRVPRQRLAG